RRRAPEEESWKDGSEVVEAAIGGWQTPRSWGPCQRSKPKAKSRFYADTNLQEWNAPPGARSHPQEGAGHCGTAASECVSFAEPYLCPGDRRPEGRHAGFGEYCGRQERSAQ